MTKINQGDVRIGSKLDRGQGGAHFSLFSESNYLRHAQITTVWEHPGGRFLGASRFRSG
jgi:hypothetical protein